MTEPAALRTVALAKRFGALEVTRDVSLVRKAVDQFAKHASSQYGSYAESLRNSRDLEAANNALNAAQAASGGGPGGTGEGMAGAAVQQAGEPGPFGTPMPPGAQPPVIQFGQGGGQGVSVNPTPQQPTPVMQFPGAQPGVNGMPVFGVGSPTPGMIVQPAQPGQPVRPPGDPQ